MKMFRAESGNKKGPEPFVYEPVPSAMSSRVIIHHPLVEVKPLANAMAKLKYVLNKRKKEIAKEQVNNVLKDCPHQRRPLEKVNFFNDSQYSGEWNYLGMDGNGIYKFPDGSTYVGEMLNGLFSGHGALRFPNGSILEGTWKNGNLVKAQYVFKDGLKYKPRDWSYCKMPDRRFHSEIVDGLKPSGNIQMGSDHPAPYVWPGCFDTVEGFYRPKTKELIHPITGKIIRIVNKPEEEWIVKSCRRHGELPFPFNPHIYENWFPQSNRTQPKPRSEESLWDSVLREEADWTKGETEEDNIPLKSLYPILKGKCILNNQLLFS